MVAHIINSAKGVFPSAIKENTLDGAVRVTTRNSGNVNIRNVDGTPTVEETRCSILDVSLTDLKDATAVLIGATG